MLALCIMLLMYPCINTADCVDLANSLGIKLWSLVYYKHNHRGGYNHWTGLLDWTTGLTQTAKYMSFSAE